MRSAGPGVAVYTARWRPSSVSPQAAAFARDVIAAVAPDGQERAKNLLWAAAKLADYAIPLGLAAVPEVLLHPSVIGAAASPRDPAGGGRGRCVRRWFPLPVRTR
jgi:hypothetical protein